jgi:hypothetical protein
MLEDRFLQVSFLVPVSNGVKQVVASVVDDQWPYVVEESHCPFVDTVAHAIRVLVFILSTVEVYA